MPPTSWSRADGQNTAMSCACGFRAPHSALRFDASGCDALFSQVRTERLFVRASALPRTLCALVLAFQMNWMSLLLAVVDIAINQFLSAIHYSMVTLFTSSKLVAPVLLFPTGATQIHTPSLTA